MKEKNNKGFWDRWAKRYDFAMSGDRKMYASLVSRMKRTLNRNKFALIKLTEIYNRKGGVEVKQKKTIEDYLKTIYILSKKKKVRGIDIAEKLKVSRPTVSVAVKELAREGYLFVDDMFEIHLTESGRKIAEETHERYNTLFCFLTDIGVNPKTASEDACEMEHAISKESYEALKSWYCKIR